MKSYENIAGDYYEDAHYKSNKAQEFHYISRESYLIDFMQLAGNEKIVDIGCGSGTFDRILAKSFPNLKITCIDISEEAIAFAKRKSKADGLKNIDFAVSGIEDIKIKQRNFDIVLVSHLIEHLKKPSKALAEVKKLLKKDGKLIITTPNYFSLWPVAEYVFDKSLARKDYSLEEQHISKFNYFSIKKLLQKEDFKVEKERALYIFSMQAALLSKKLAQILFYVDKFLSPLPIGMIIYIKAQKK